MPAHKWHIWFCPTRKANPSTNAKHSRIPLKINYAMSKTKRAIFCQRNFDDGAT